MTSFLNKTIMLLGVVTLFLIFALPSYMVITCTNVESILGAFITPTITSLPPSTPTPYPTLSSESQQTQSIYSSTKTERKIYKCQYNNCGIVESYEPSFCDTNVCCEVSGRWSVMSSFECAQAQRNENEVNANSERHDVQKSAEEGNVQKCNNYTADYLRCKNSCLAKANEEGDYQRDCENICLFYSTLKNKYCN